MPTEATSDGDRKKTGATAETSEFEFANNSGREQCGELSSFIIERRPTAKVLEFDKRVVTTGQEMKLA